MTGTEGARRHLWMGMTKAEMLEFMETIEWRRYERRDSCWINRSPMHMTNPQNSGYDFIEATVDWMRESGTEAVHLVRTATACGHGKFKMEKHGLKAGAVVSFLAGAKKVRCVVAD